MNLTVTIQDAVKTNKVILGYRETIRFIKVNSPKLIVMARNIPEKMKDEIEHNVHVSGTKMETFEGTSKELGIICGKEFPISALVVRE